MDQWLLADLKVVGRTALTTHCVSVVGLIHGICDIRG